MTNGNEMKHLRDTPFRWRWKEAALPQVGLFVAARAAIPRVLELIVNGDKRQATLARLSHEQSRVRASAKRNVRPDQGSPPSFLLFLPPPPPPDGSKVILEVDNCAGRRKGRRVTLRRPAAAVFVCGEQARAGGAHLFALLLPRTSVERGHHSFLPADLSCTYNTHTREHDGRRSPAAWPPLAGRRGNKKAAAA